ncbi:hypothetical protein [Kutzneria sp. NPDC051319]|uniref:hypothetical protein n=1 Tax=Kutzneria sp. NPDC051319 TaxID=3155047 RepID=UPI0034217287
MTTESVADDRVGDEFLDLLCADDELVRAEFDAIIAAEWSTPPDPAEPRPAAMPPSDVPPTLPARRGRRGTVDRRWPRARSPPERVLLGRRGQGGDARSTMW